MSETKFNVGDLVRLKSGGPAMTVEHVLTPDDNDYFYDCAWFDGNKFKRDDFRECTLVEAGAND